jgi:hypothetical protein
VGADLVGPASSRACFEQSKAREPFKNRKASQRRLAPGSVNDGAVPPVAVTAQREVDLALFPGWDANCERMVYFGDISLLKLCVEIPVGCSAAGKDDHAAGLAVEAMYDPQAAKVWLEDLCQIGLLSKATTNDQQTGGFVGYQE